MKIFTAEQLYAADRSTIEKQQITSHALMERAAMQLFNWLHPRLEGAPRTIRLFCGIGNNGGDGLALARFLKEHGYSIVVYIVNYSDKRSEDFLENLDRLKSKKVWPEILGGESELPGVGRDDLVVDAIFGIGLNRPPDPWVGKLIKHLNASGAFIVSVDVPSGMFTDRDSLHDRIITASMVLSFQAPKLPFFLPETGPYCEHWEVLDIGLDAEFPGSAETRFELVGKGEARGMYRPRRKFSHKGTYGHALIIGGSYGKTGAVQLAASACLHAGSGLVTAYVPRCGYLPLQTALPEAMVLPDSGDDHIVSMAFDLLPDAVGIGIGMGTMEETVRAFETFLDRYQGKLVVDADGINMLAGKNALMKKLPPKTILTPHPGELRRLIGPWKGDYDKLGKAMEFSKKYDCILLIKGAHSMTLYEGKGYVNSTGNPGMATAGSGDALTGILTALLAQGYPALDAAIFGTYLHGKAGDLAAAKSGYEFLTAGGIITGLGEAFPDLFAEESHGDGEEEGDG